MTTTTRRKKKYEPTPEQKERRAAVQALIKKLTDEWKAGMHREVITFMDEHYSQHSHYSELNRLLIFFQRPEADKADLATSAAWKTRGFHPTKGEHGIAIRAHHDEQGDDGAQNVGFHLIYLFDPSQVTPFDQSPANADPDQEGQGEEGETTQAEPEQKSATPALTAAPAPVTVIQAGTQEQTPGILALLAKREPVASNVLDILGNAYFQGDLLILPSRLERKDYEAVNKVIERIGGKWNRRAKGHVFEDEEDPRQLLQLILETGEMPGKNPTAFYGTSQGLAARIAEGIPADARAVLEPSAGTGAIARAIRDYCAWQRIDAALTCVEVLPKFAARLREQGFSVIEGDFLQHRPERPYNAIRMNPPYALEGDPLAYVTHVLHAWDLLAEGGNLKAIVAAGFTFRQDRRVKELRDLVENNGTWEELPDDSFKGSGTGVRTALLEMSK